MDDDDLGPSTHGTDEDLSLPKATMAKLIQELLPPDMVCAKEARDLLTDCCVEFIHLLSSESNEIAERETRKTISGEHVVAALKSLGFESYVDQLDEVVTDHQKNVKDREKRRFRLERSGLTEEELLRSQEELFAKARERFAAGMSGAAVSAPAGGPAAGEGAASSDPAAPGPSA
ncbi:histone-fold-containing protein [Entophlyctis helioformis]|nr:histone-fold-containing protein [Entophlyctis helioformis]